MSLVKYAVIFTMYAQAQDTNPIVAPEIEVPPIAQKGNASWYGDGQWHGDFTASGEPMDPTEFTCAHRDLPFDTVVMLEHPKTHRRVWCRINDRGPYGALNEGGDWEVVVYGSEDVRYRGVLDMSIATARSLGTIDNGLRFISLRYWRKTASTLFDLAVWAKPKPYLK